MGSREHVNIGMKELANICGVSMGTVDRALHDRPGINPETKQRILTIANEVQYRPHFAASSLANGATKTIGVVVYDLTNFFFSQLVEAIEARARASGYYVYLMLSHEEEKQQLECLNHLRGLNVDGIVILPTGWSLGLDKLLKNLRCPIVTVSNKVSRAWSWVGIDDARASRETVQYLISKGYERIVYVSPRVADFDPRRLSSIDQRLLGYKNALKEEDPVIKSMIVDVTEMPRILEVIRDKSSRKTCILCSGDIQALAVMKMLKDNAIRIPQDVGVMGFDNIDVLQYVNPRLTTVASPIKEIGDKAFDCLMDQINGGAVQNLTLPHRIVEGESL